MSNIVVNTHITKMFKIGGITDRVTGVLLDVAHEFFWEEIVEGIHSVRRFCDTEIFLKNVIKFFFNQKVSMKTRSPSPSVSYSWAIA